MSCQMVICLFAQKNGGLGVLSLRTQSKAMMIKFLYNFFNNKDTPWVQLVWEAHYPEGKVPIGSSTKGYFWWRDCSKLIVTFKQNAICNMKKGDTILLWKDKWLDNQRTLQGTSPQLHSFAKNH